jgi:hypothetical protein
MVSKIIFGVLLTIILFGVVYFIIIPKLQLGSNNILKLHTIIDSNKDSYKNIYNFTAEKIITSTEVTSTENPNPCTITKKNSEGIATEIQCKKNSKQSFDISMKNNNYRHETLTFMGGIVVCEFGNKNCCENSKISTSSEDCILYKGETKNCDAGTYKFMGEYKKYEVHPATQCISNKESGCYDPSVTSSFKSCNPNNYVTVVMIN